MGPLSPTRPRLPRVPAPFPLPSEREPSSKLLTGLAHHTLTDVETAGIQAGTATFIAQGEAAAATHGSWQEGAHQEIWATGCPDRTADETGRRPHGRGHGGAHKRPCQVLPYVGTSLRQVWSRVQGAAGGRPQELPDCIVDEALTLIPKAVYKSRKEVDRTPEFQAIYDHFSIDRAPLWCRMHEHDDNLGKA